MMDYNDIKKYFMELNIVQDMQIAAFELGNNIHSNDIISSFDLEIMIFERNRAFENLRNAISLVSRSVLNSFKEDAETIINKDKIFMTKLEDRKNELLRKINHSAKGKQLLKGYRINSEKTLRFMNNKV